MNNTHTHPTYHKGHVFPAEVRAVGPDLPMRETLREMDVLVFAVPTEGLRSVFFSADLSVTVCSNGMGSFFGGFFQTNSREFEAASPEDVIWTLVVV